MAGITRRYTSLNQIVADEAFSNSLFREEDYNKAKETGTDVDYLLAMANTKDNVAKTFDRTVYNKLSDDDRFNYFVHKNYGEVGSKQYNDTELYFNNQIEQIKKQEIYDNLSGFDKTVNSVGGLLASVGLQFVGIVENLVDAAPALVGQIAGLFGDDATFQASKEFVAKDITGYSAAQQQLNDYLNTYTFVDKNWFTKGLNDVLTGITRMTPMLVGNLLAPVTGGISAGIGNFMYYSSLYGSSAEELYSKNIDASWFDSLIYTGGNVGLEALTEWTSAKLFGGSWFDPVNPSLQKGSLSKFGKDLWHDMWTESVEEAVSEIFGGMLYQKYIDPQKETSLQDILYAAIIGGITGGILSGGKAVFGTTRYAVYNGNIVDVKSLTEEQLKSAKKLGFGKSYELDSRITETTQTLDKTNNVSNLQAKYKTLSLDQIKSEHADEYKKAVDKDAELNKNKSTVVLGLAQFLSTIGEENFVKAVDTLKTYSQQVEEMVTNFINHTDTYNKTASAIFSEANPGKSFTPTAVPTNSEQLLAKTLREAFPKMKVVFGEFGSEDGLSVSSINGTEGWLFIESGLVDSKGFDSVLGESIRNELSREILDDLADLTPEHADALATLITSKATKYDDLTEQEKTDVAKIICFDPVSNRRIFQRDNKVHSKIFKSLSDKAEYVKRFGRQTKANIIRYHDLLEIRNTFFNSIAKTISNSEDVAFVEDEYALLADEIKTKIIDKTIETRLNRYVKLTGLNQSKETIMRKEAYTELSDARKSQEGDFDFTRLYDKSYYKDEYVNSLTQNTTDFKMALDDHLKNTYETSFSTRPTYIKMLKDNLSEETTREAANGLLTKEFLESNPDYETLQNQVVEQLWFMMVFGTQDPKADSITLTENQIKGAGKLKFIISEVADGKRILSEEQRREDGESSGEQTRRLAPNTAEYENKLLETAALRVQTEDSLDEHQQKLKSDYKQKYNLDLKFFKGNISYRGQVLDNANGLVSDNTVYLKYDGTLTDAEIDYVLEHEATHKMFAADEKAFEEIKSVIEDYVDRQEYNEAFKHYASDEMYGKIYDHDIDAIKEELINDIIVGEVTLSYSDVNEVNKKIEQFKERSTLKLSGKIDSGVKFSIDDSFWDEFSLSELDYLLSDTPYVKSTVESVSQEDVLDNNRFIKRDNTLIKQEVVTELGFNLITETTASWTQDRLNRLINEYGSVGNPNYARAYATFIDPKDFIRLTTFSDEDAVRISRENDNRPTLTNENIKKEPQTPYLVLDSETMQVVMHEGRHRFEALSRQGIDRVPVVINFVGDSFDRFNANKIYNRIIVTPQNFDGKVRRNFNTTLYEVIPLNEANRANLEKKFIKESPLYKAGVRFSISKQNEQELKNIQNRAKAKTGKEIADAIIGIVKTMPMKMSEAQGFETPYMYRSIEDLAGTLDSNSLLFHKINDKNWAELYGALHNSVDPDSRQALILLEAYLRIADQTNTRSKGYKPLDDKTRFSEQSKNEIMALYQSSASLTGQHLSAISKMVSDKTSFSELKQRFEEDGFTMSVPDKVVQQYVPEVKDKKSFEKEINKQIDDITEQIENGDDLDKAVLNQELSKLIDKKYVILNESNEAIIDWVLSNEDVPTVAAKIQQDVFKQFVATAELAEKTEGKKALTILVDEKTGLPKPFPKTTQYVQKAVKGLKSFRMWAMLTSPVSWVRNWVGNAGMTALDKATNQFEKFLTNRQPKVDIASLEKQQKALQNKKDLTPAEQAKLAELNAQITRAYDFKFVETTASKELKQQIAEEYASVFQQILNGEDVSKYEGSAEKAGAIARAERDITRKSENANFVQKVWAACQSMTDWGLNTGAFGDNAVVLNSLVRNFANMVESNKPYLIKSLTTEYGKDGAGMSDARKALVEKALKSKDSMDIINAMSKADVELFMDSCKQRTFEQYFKNSNWLSKWASNLSQKHPIAASLTSLVLPFPKVAANVLTMAYKYSPLGFISALRQWSVVKQMDAEGYKGYRDAFARAKLNRTTAQATVGTMMCIAGLILASLGAIDIEEDDYMGPSLHIGDLRISLSDLAPSMTTLSVGAGMMWAWKNDKSAVLTALDVLYDNTLLGNIENVFKYGSPDKYIENLSINYVSQYVPAMLKLFTKITTNQEMIDKSGTYFEKLWKTFGSGIPGIAHVLPKRVNPYTGEFLTSTGSQNVFFNFIEAISPLDFETTIKSPTQKEAERLNTKTTGLSGTFKINNTEYVVDKVTYSKYRADYIQTSFEQILSGKQKVTVEDDNGKRITTTYDKLNDKQKKNVIDRLYTDATNITKIKWWTDLGNKYVVTNEDQFKQYRKLFDTRNIVYKKTWNKSKFMER